MRPARAASFLLPLALLLGATAPAQVPAPAPGEEQKIEWHTVKAGETLEGITAHYLGSSRLWPENHRLNPQVKNPHVLHPGERIRVIVSRRRAARTARVELVERRVDDKPEPMPWTAARTGDLLKERDGVRTYTRSSTQLAFDDGSHLVLTEDSLVFLRRMEAPAPAGKGGSAQAIEIIEGRADLDVRPLRGSAPSRIEIVMGDAVARPAAGPAGVAQARARKKKEGEAQLMVFEGGSDVASAGKTVKVPRGMGTRVAPGKPPEAPERLLPAAGLEGPPEGETLGFANPAFSWEAVPGARSYSVEVCRDEACGALVAVSPKLDGTEWASEPLPKGTLRWRVTANGASGLDGYPSKPRVLTIASEGVDREPPSVVVWLEGAGAVPPDGTIEVAAGGRLLLAAKDDLSGVASIRYRWNGGAWETLGAGGLRPPPSPSRSLLEFQAFDRAGLASPVHSVGVRGGNGETR